MPFSLLVFAILESCISFAGQQVMSNVTDDIARQLRTGQIRVQRRRPSRRAKLKRHDLRPAGNHGRRRLSRPQGRSAQLRHVRGSRRAAAFSITGSSKNNRTLAPSNFTFDPGPSLSKNVLRVFYEWPVITDFMRASMSNLQGGKTLHFATVTWQNEPFDD